MPHKILPIDSLEIEEGYNIIRSDKELKQNVKDVEAQMAQQGDEPTAFPIRYVLGPGKRKFTRNHATFLAAKARNWPNVYAIELPYEAGSLRDVTDLITSNSGGHPISRVKQGELYLRMSEGELKPDLENGKEIDPETDYVRKPMSDKEIAEAFSPVYSTEHIRQCKVLAQSSPDVQELIESDQVALNVVVKAKGWAKDDDAKQLRILKAAIKAANADGKAKATDKHLESVKSDFVKLKAAPVDSADPAPAKTKTKTSAGDNGQQEATEDENKGDTQAPAPDPEAENLFSQAESELLTEGSKKNKKLIDAFKTFLLDDDGLTKINVSMTLNEDEAETLATELVKIAANAREVF